MLNHSQGIVLTADSSFDLPKALSPAKTIGQRERASQQPPRVAPDPRGPVAGMAGQVDRRSRVSGFLGRQSAIAFRCFAKGYQMDLKMLCQEMEDAGGPQWPAACGRKGRFR